MSAGTSAASETIPKVVLATAGAMVRRKTLLLLAAALSAVLMIQAGLFLALLRRPLTRLYVSETTLLLPTKIEKGTP